MAKFSSKFNAEINKSVYKFIKTFAQLLLIWLPASRERGEGEDADRGSLHEGSFLMAAHDAKVFCADVIHLTRSTKPPAEPRQVWKMRCDLF